MEKPLNERVEFRPCLDDPDEGGEAAVGDGLSGVKTVPRDEDGEEDFTGGVDSFSKVP